MSNSKSPGLPGLDCGQCGSPTCREFAMRLEENPDLLRRCIHLGAPRRAVAITLPMTSQPRGASAGACSSGCAAPGAALPWQDCHGREVEFYLEHFPEDPGPREVILPHNPMLTREMGLQPGDYIVGRPLGMSCGCPVTHCGVVMEADPRSGVITWCVTGPMQAREKGFKDVGYYSAEAYEGMVRERRVEIKIGMRYFFQPRMCMLQWRHSGLVNYLNRTSSGLQVRLEGLWIG